jgi:hypothetical protein
MIHDALGAMRRNRLRFTVGAVILTTVVIFFRLEMGYRTELARDPATTGSVANAPRALSQMQSDSLALPTLAAATQPRSVERTQAAAQRVPLPRPRPNRS